MPTKEDRMAKTAKSILWSGSDAYEAYMGRWSRPMARSFVAWFGAPAALRWLDVGCGTGALASAALDQAQPREVVGIDPSADFIGSAAGAIADPRAHFTVGDARSLPFTMGEFEAVVSGLVLNHIAEPEPATAEMARVTRAGGVVGSYVWDYSGEMQLIRFFWEAATTADADAAHYDPRGRYRICTPNPLAALFREAGLRDVAVEAIDLPLAFRDFEDYWRPHTMAGPAAPQRYVATLDDDRKASLRKQLRATLPIAADGTITLLGRAWAVRAIKPPE